jgi:Dolichyl-phosphate-mannose--protein O-mannosyl transferase
MNKEQKLNKLDYIILTVITFSYAIFSFINLGAFTNPNTFVKGKELSFELGEEEQIEKLRYFTGNEFINMKVYTSTDNEEFFLEEASNQYGFAWLDLQIDKNVKYLKIELDENTTLGEISLINGERKYINIKGLDKNSKKLIDEQETVPSKISYLNSSYFDEIYFARTAYEYATGGDAYEWVHPPLGKLIMAIPIKLFGMSPFNYRLMGNLAGILMIPVLYILAKRLFKQTKYAILPALLITFDTFHYAHTRLATVDSFLVLFIMLSILFMIDYISYKKEDKKRFIKLFLSGLFFGLSVCTKWTGMFTGLALAIIFFIDIFKNIKEKRKIINTLFLAFIFFVVIPLTIYISLYLLFPNMYYYSTGSLDNVTEITKNMYNYHSSLSDPHPFYSAWYTWPLMIKPVWYHVDYIGSIKSTISGFGNPIIWWFGTISMIYLIYKVIKKDKTACILLLIYICSLISYLNISRGMYLYHYFPALITTYLGSTVLIKDITEKTKKDYVYICLIVLAIIFFIYFFPVVSGTPTDSVRIDNLKWLSSWYF